MSEKTLRDIVNESPDEFEAGDNASEKVLQEDVDKAAERYKLIKGAKKAIKRAKIKDTAKKIAKATLPGAGAIGDMIGSAGAFLGAKASKASSNKDRLTEADIIGSASPYLGGMKRGQAVMARGCKLGRKKKTIIT